MYIPVSYFSTRGACITTETSTIGGSGIVTSGSFYSSSQVYNWLKFEMSNLTSSALQSAVFSLTISTGSTQDARIVVVAGGGSGTTTGSFSDGSQTFNVRSAAGGGGGGVVQYSKFPLSPGVYEIGVGAASPIANTTFLTGSKGNNSYFKNIFPYTPFSTPFITAEGGGTGNIRGTVSGLNGAFGYLFGVNGGSGGGASMTFRTSAFPSYQNALSGTLGLSTLGGLTNGTSSAGGGASGVYIIKLEYASGSLVAAPFVNAKDPSGATITSGSGGWTFTRNGANEITITHPLGVWPVNFMTHAQLSTGDFMSRMMHGSATSQSVVVQNTAKTTMNFKALSTTAMGIYGTGTAYAYITFELPSNDIYI